MNAALRFLHEFYGVLLNLYPRAYHTEYGEELQTVFTLSLREAGEQGGWIVTAVTIRELTAFPQAVILAHLRERRKVSMLKRFNSFFDFTHGSRVEFLAAIFPVFLLGGFLQLVNLLGTSGVIPVPNPWLDRLGFVLGGLFLLLFTAGLVSGAPRWFLPYLGILLSFFSVYGFSQWLEKWIHIPYSQLYQRSWFIGAMAYQGSLWVGLSSVVLFAIVLIPSIPALRRFKNDWTLLLFVLYGSVPFALIFAFDDYSDEEPFVFLASLALAAGAWLYLRSDGPKYRFLALFGGLTVAMFIAAFVKATTLVGPSLPYPYERRPDLWGHEMLSTIIIWMWIALSFLLSAALSRLLDSRSASLSR